MSKFSYAVLYTTIVFGLMGAANACEYIPTCQELSDDPLIGCQASICYSSTDPFQCECVPNIEMQDVRIQCRGPLPVPPADTTSE